MQLGYTRELRYGFYKNYRPKSGGYEGIDPATTFTLADAQVVLLVHLRRTQAGDQFFVVWIDPQGNRLETPVMAVTSRGSLWIPFTLSLFGKPTGTCSIEGYLNGQKVFTDTFIVMSS